MYSYGSPHMAAQKQDDQLERTFSSYVRIQDVVLKTYLGRWTIGRSGERGSGISVLPARYDDDDIYIYIYIFKRKQLSDSKPVDCDEVTICITEILFTAIVDHHFLEQAWHKVEFLMHPLDLYSIHFEWKHNVWQKYDFIEQTVYN